MAAHGLGSELMRLACQSFHHSYLHTVRVLFEAHLDPNGRPSEELTTALMLSADVEIRYLIAFYAIPEACC